MLFSYLMFQLSLSFFTLFYIDNGFLTSPLTFLMISLNPSPSNTSETESIYCAIYSLTPLSSSLLGQAHSPLGIAAAVLQCCVRLRRHPHQPTTTVYHATGTSLVRLDLDHLEWICIGRGRQQSSGGSPDPDGLSAGGRGGSENLGVAAQTSLLLLPLRFLLLALSQCSQSVM